MKLKLGEPYLAKLEAANEEYKTALIKVRDILRIKEFENENLKANLEEVKSEIKAMKEKLENTKNQKKMKY